MGRKEKINKKVKYNIFEKKRLPMAEIHSAYRLAVTVMEVSS